MNHLHNILKIGGSLGSFVLANSLDPTGCTGAIVQAIAGNLASNFVAKYDPSELLKYLNKPNPDLNHDIEKLMIESVPKAVELVTIKYYQENPYDDKFVKKTLKRLIEDAKIMPNNTYDGLMTTDKDAWLEDIHEYIFRGYEDEEGKLIDIETFFKNHLKNCYQLVFTEGLKDDKDEKPLKAFLIKSLNGLAEQTDKNSEIQAKILAEIQKLKDEKPTESFTIAKSYFENEFNKVDKRLIELLEIAKKTDGKIDLIYQYFGIIEQKIDKLQEGQDKIIGILENQVPPLPKHLTRPPLVPEVFRGRKDELEKIHKQLFEGENLLLLVNGEGGIGKTSLAAKYYQQYTTHYKHLAWVLCEQSITDALLQLAFPLKVQFEDTATAAQRLEILLTYMANMDTPCLLIIDNANEVEDLQQNYEHLRRCPNFHVLLTSRINEYRHAQFFKIESLSPEQALAVFREHYPKLQAQEEPIFEGIYDAVGGNTLVLELLAKNLTQQNSLKTKYQLADLLADLQTKGLLQIVEDDDVLVEYQSYRIAKPTEIIAAMYDLSKLSEAESRLLSIFAVLPAESIAYEVLETLLPNTQNLDKTLLNLAQKGWLSHNTKDSSFKCSPVIQEIILAKNQNIYDDCEEFIWFLINKLEYEAGIGTLINATYTEGVMYARFVESIVNNVEQVEYNLACLCERTGNFYQTHGNIEKGVFYAEKDISISGKLVEQYPENENYKNGLAVSYQNLGELHQSLGNLDKALVYFEKYNQLENELYRDFPNQVQFKNLLAISYQYIGILQKSLGNLDKALGYFEQYNQLENELYRDFPNQVSFKNSLAVSYCKLGELHQSLGNLDKALGYFEQYNQLANELYRDFPNQVSFKNSLAVSYSKLGELQQSLGSLDKALGYFEQYNQLENELYRDYPNQVSFKNSLAISYQYSGELQQSLGRLDKALGYFEQYNQLVEELYRDYPNQVNFKNGLAISYSKLGNLQQSLGNLGKALENFEDETKLFEELYRDYPNQVAFIFGLATSYLWLGNAQKENNEIEKANINFQNALPLLEDLCQKVPIPHYQKQLAWVKNALSGLGE